MSVHESLYKKERQEHSIINMIRAAQLVVKGYDEGIYPRSVIKASHVKRLFPYDDINRGILSSIGRGLSDLAAKGYLVRIGNGPEYKYLINCSRYCDRCPHRGTMDCPVMKLRALVYLFEGDSNE